MTENIYKKAKQIRLFEELLLKLFSEGKLNGTVHTCIGQEVIPAIVSCYLSNNDVIFSNHRGHGHYIAATNDVEGLLAEVMGKEAGCSGGYGGSQHLYKEGKFYSNGIQGGMSPISLGYALNKKVNSTNGICIQFIGDGTLGEGALYEAWNLSVMLEAPVLCIVENNGYAQSTSNKQTFRGSLKERANGFGCKYFQTDIWNFDSIYEIVGDAISSARSNVPTILEINCYRLKAHSKGDDNRFLEEILQYESIDPINVFENENEILSLKITQQLESEINSILKQVQLGKTLSNAKIENLVFKKDVLYKNLNTAFHQKRYSELISESFISLARVKKNTLFIGEDIQTHNKYTPKKYGGAFKTTLGLSDYSNNVINSPISESAITGISIGYALAGDLAITEIMFGDFLTLSFDQLLQHGSKFNGMYGKKLTLPFIVRTPMGGKRGYGPTHSQCLEKHFLGMPGINVIALNYLINPFEFYTNLFNEINSPHLIIENKVDYSKTDKELKISTHDYYISDCLCPTIRISPKYVKPYVTIVCYGGILKDVEKSAYEYFITTEKGVEIICYSQISPINMKPVIDSVSKTNKVITIEEGSKFVSFGSEIISNLVVEGISLNFCKKVGNDSIIPSSLDAELNLIPSSKVISEILKQI